MKLSSALLSVAALLPFAAAKQGRSALHAFQRADKVKEAFNEKLAARAAEATRVEEPLLQKRASPFATNATQKFAVDGTKIPDVPFDIGESYAGLLPISDNANETRKLYFWFFPSTNPNATDEITIWFNGGPGCSSLSGLLTENGPFTWEAGTYAPVQNPYTWVNLTNMLWVEQPVGVGFSQGTPDISNELELAKEFAGFYKSFVDTFDAHGSKVYITGESYAGFYVPYVANEFLNRNDTDYYNLAGIAINDPIIGDEVLQQEGKYQTTKDEDNLLTGRPSHRSPVRRLLVQPFLPQRYLHEGHQGPRRQVQLHVLPGDLPDLPSAPGVLPCPARPVC
ncbi:Peptidase S10 serine carboxypeptidase [Macrophomina phaseolina MS6]|uniref:Carboxypeptidase n=1 Tax=Macrophomina phaseolina (strain MS6) TaxID=1126212 RepID=K2RLJ4_MACPH|nr:Peptidase S10 serine carboxypeptidase [Macrophomina phaseolina MS6]